MNYIKKDITTIVGPAVILHGVNCKRTMRSGVAKALFTRWPNVREEYMNFAEEEMTFGKVAPVKVGDSLYVINCWTQEDYGYDNKSYANPAAIKDCLAASAKFCNQIQIKNIYMPRIGCGLGGLNWERDVQPLIAEIEPKNPDLSFTICDF